MMCIFNFGVFLFKYARSYELMLHEVGLATKLTDLSCSYIQGTILLKIEKLRKLL